MSSVIKSYIDTKDFIGLKRLLQNASDNDVYLYNTMIYLIYKNVNIDDIRFVFQDHNFSIIENLYKFIQQDIDTIRLFFDNGIVDNDHKTPQVKCLQEHLVKYLINNNQSIQEVIEWYVEDNNHIIKELVKKSSVSSETITLAVLNIGNQLIHEEHQDIDEDTHEKLYTNTTKNRIKYRRLLDLFIDTVDIIPDDLVFEIVDMYYYGTTDLITEKSYKVEDVEIFLRKKYVLQEEDNRDFTMMLYNIITDTESPELFERYMNYYHEQVEEYNMYNHLYIVFMGILNKDVFKQFRKILSKYISEDKAKETILNLLEDPHYIYKHNMFEELKRMGYEPLQEHYKLYRNDMLKIFTIKELKKSGIVYSVKGNNDELSYKDVMKIYMLNRGNYDKNIKAFYRDLETLTKQDYRHYQIENNILLNMMNNYITNIVIEYADLT